MQPDSFQLLHFLLTASGLAIVDQTIQSTVLELQCFQIILHDILLARFDRQTEAIDLIEMNRHFQFIMSIRLAEQ